MKAWIVRGAVLAVLVGLGHAQAEVISIDSMTKPHVVVDFDLMPAGPTSVEAINLAFPDAGIVSLTFAEVDGTGTYNFNTDGGRALSPDGLGGLTLVDVGAEFYDATELVIDLDHLTRQFGFAIGDRSDTGDMNTLLYDVSGGPTLVGTYSAPQTGLSQFFESTIPFDRVVFQDGANWVVPELVVGLEDVPEPSALVLLSTAAVALLVFTRRRRHRR